MNTLSSARPAWLLHLTLTVATGAFLAGCAATPTPVAAPTPTLPPPVQVAPAPAPAPAIVSDARTTQGYRFDAASHLYTKNLDRIYRGIMPHYLYAIGVVQLQVDSMGQVVDFKWMRAPEHAPEVIAEIEHTLRQAAPYPAPVHMGYATYIETWLWDSSGRFQLRTLTEGQGGVATAASRLLNAPVVRVVTAPASSTEQVQGR